MRGASAQNVDLVTFDVMIETRENDHFCDFNKYLISSVREKNREMESALRELQSKCSSG